MVKLLNLFPLPKFASMSQLTLELRYKIEGYLKANISVTEISSFLSIHRSVIYREINRNKNSINANYDAEKAEHLCRKRHLLKTKKRHFTATIELEVINGLEFYKSPEQITGEARRLKKSMVSHESIYKFIWKDKRAGGKLYEYLRTQRKRYRKRGSAKDKRGQIEGRVGIEMRPAIVDERKRLGDCEMDLIIGENHKSALLTINDRASGMVIIKKVPSKEAENISKIAIRALKFWAFFIKTITSDNGKEFALFKTLENTLKIKYYFARPYHSWERGSNENLNGLIRQFYPKGTDFNEVSDYHIKKVEQNLNNRPRKRFGYISPNDVFCKAIKNNGIVAFIS